MLQIVPKWKVSVQSHDHNSTIWISETHLSNVLKTLASIQFTENGLGGPLTLTISLDPGSPIVGSAESGRYEVPMQRGRNS